jgi:NAD(P)-dependent dehydrogenase (short-subunit alcohol dehydrogenase family)
MKSKFSLDGQVVVITGGAGRLGKIFSLEVAKAGGKVCIADVSVDLGQKASDEINKAFPESSMALLLDITNEESLRSAFDQVITKYGKITTLVNNAYPRNKTYGRKFFDVTYESFSENISTHLGGYFLCSKVVTEFFKPENNNSIINISSIYGVMAPRFEVYDGTEMTMPVEYCVIKSGLIHLTKYMAKYFKGKNIRVNSLCPGGIEAGQPKTFLDAYSKNCLLKGMLEPEDISSTLVYLASDASLYVNGQNIIVDDGYSL